MRRRKRSQSDCAGVEGGSDKGQRLSRGGLETDGYLSRESKKKIVLTKKGVDSLRTYMREVYVLRDALMQICKLPRNVAYHEALKAVGALSGRSIEALTDFFEKNVVKKAV